MINVRTIAQETSFVFSFFIDFTSRNNIRGEDAVRLLNKKIPPRQGDFIFFHKCSNVTTTRSIEGIAICFYKWIFHHFNVFTSFTDIWKQRSEEIGQPQKKIRKKTDDN